MVGVNQACSALCAAFHFILRIALWGGHCHPPHFTDGTTKPWRGRGPRPGPPWDGSDLTAAPCPPHRAFWTLCRVSASCPARLCSQVPRSQAELARKGPSMPRNPVPFVVLPASLPSKPGHCHWHQPAFGMPFLLCACCCARAPLCLAAVGIKTESSVGLLSLCVFGDKAPWPPLPQGICCKGIKTQLLAPMHLGFCPTAG